MSCCLSLSQDNDGRLLHDKIDRVIFTPLFESDMKEDPECQKRQGLLADLAVDHKC